MAIKLLTCICYAEEYLHLPPTDIIGTPWAEWYDLPKLLNLLEPAKFDVVLYHEFHNRDFNWFDLVRRE